MSKFQHIIAFLRVAELGSFTAASRVLNTTVSAVTKSITRLEEDLKVQLLHRSSRALHLTEFGKTFYDRCGAILADLEDAESEIRQGNSTLAGTVRLALPPSFARRTLIPALPEFQQLYPDLRLNVSVKHTAVNPIEGGFDLVVHSGRLADSRLINRILVRGTQRTVASPAYLDRHGIPQRPADLAMHPCIVGAFGPDWRFRAQGGKTETLRVSGNLVTDSGDIMREAALAGLGITQATWWVFNEDLAAGRLVPLLEPWEIEADPISIIFPAHPRTPVKVRAVADFLLKITRIQKS